VHGVSPFFTGVTRPWTPHPGRPLFSRLTIADFAEGASQLSPFCEKSSDFQASPPRLLYASVGLNILAKFGHPAEETGFADSFVPALPLVTKLATRN